jgi:hypothetical protein
MTNQPTTTTAFLALILIGAGSSWAKASTIDEAVAEAGRICSCDWGSIFNFNDEPVTVNVYELPSLDASWHATCEGVFVNDSTESLDLLELREVVLTNKD